jgi:predicted nucleic acid-binding Zn ribbon protein
MKADPRKPKSTPGADSRLRAVAPLSAAVQAYLRASGLGPRIRDAEIYRAWNEAVGPELARRARPARFRGGELLVEVDSSAHLGELQSFTGEQYREQANRLFDAPRIERVVFKLKR